MNTRYLLPGSLALTFHAFVLLGLSDRTPVTPEAADHPAQAGRDWVKVDSPEALADPADQDDPDVEQHREQGLAPSLGPIVIPAYPGPADWAPVPPMPPARGGPAGISVIPADWAAAARDGSRSFGDAIDSGRLDRTPRARAQPAPIYPADLRASGIEGTVVVEFLVDREGNVCGPVVVRASHPGFSEPALRAVARWRFEPGTCGGKRVRFRMSVPLVFTLRGP